MGVDAKLLVLHDYRYGDGQGFVSDVFTMLRNYSLFEILETHLKDSGKPWKAIQLPLGAHSHVLDRTDEYDDSGENGWLTKDPYESSLQSLSGSQLKEALLQCNECNDYNKRLAELIGELFPDRDIVIFFC